MASLSLCKPMPPNEPLVNAIQLKRAVKDDKVESGNSCKDDEMDRTIKKLEFDLNRPLKHFLERVFKNGGRVVLAFPGSSYEQVKEVADDIKEEVEPTWILSAFFWVWSWIFPHQRAPTIDVEVVQTITTPVEEYMSIVREEVQKSIKKDPNIDLVKLVSSETETEALTVDLQQGRVYFDDHSQDDTSIFFRVVYESAKEFFKTNNNCNDLNDPGLIVILINLKTFLPIGKNENDELYAMLPEVEICPPLARLHEIDIPDNIAHPFHWLPKILQDPSDKSYFYYQRGSDESSIIYPTTEPDAVRRISKGDNNAAVIRDSNMEFVVHSVKTHGRTH